VKIQDSEAGKVKSNEEKLRKWVFLGIGIGARRDLAAGLPVR
jgi:hypothetical protein